MLITRLKRPNVEAYIHELLERGDLMAEYTTLGDIKKKSDEGGFIKYKYPREILDAINTWSNDMKCKQYYHVRDTWERTYVFIEAIEL